MNKVTESRYRKFATGGPNRYTYTHAKTNYSIKFNDVDGKGTRMNTSTFAIREICRKMIESTESESKIDFSSKELIIKPLKEAIPDFPDIWKDIDNLSYQTSKYNTTLIDLETEEAQQILELMKESMSNVIIHQIERVQNFIAFYKYIKEKSLMMSKHGVKDDSTIEKHLFHGTGKTNPDKILGSENSFDMRYAIQASYGRGLYFTENAAESDRYAHVNYEVPKFKQMREVFLATILVGRPKATSPDETIISPPLDPKTGDRYDSITGIGSKSSNFVIYDNGRCYPTYLIRYTTKKLLNFGTNFQLKKS